MTAPLLLDLALLLVILVNALRGWRNGLVAGVLGLMGMLLGVLAALWAIPLLMEQFGVLPNAGPWRSLGLLAAVVVAAELGREHWAGWAVGSSGHELLSAHWTASWGSSLPHLSPHCWPGSWALP